MEGKGEAEPVGTLSKGASVVHLTFCKLRAVGTLAEITSGIFVCS